MSAQVSLSELRSNTSMVVKRVDREAEPVAITRRGRVIALIVPLVQAVADPGELTSNELEAIRVGVARAKLEIRAGRGIPLDEAKRTLRAKWAKRNGKSARK